VTQCSSRCPSLSPAHVASSLPHTHVSPLCDAITLNAGCVNAPPCSCEAKEEGKNVHRFAHCQCCVWCVPCPHRLACARSSTHPKVRAATIQKIEENWSVFATADAESSERKKKKMEVLPAACSSRSLPGARASIARHLVALHCPPSLTVFSTCFPLTLLCSRLLRGVPCRNTTKALTTTGDSRPSQGGCIHQPGQPPCVRRANQHQLRSVDVVVHSFATTPWGVHSRCICHLYGTCRCCQVFFDFDKWTVSSSLLPGTLWGIHDSGLKTLARTMSARVLYCLYFGAHAQIYSRHIQRSVHQ
jgi:hypothetical protein